MVIVDVNVYCEDKYLRKQLKQVTDSFNLTPVMVQPELSRVRRNWFNFKQHDEQNNQIL